MEDELVTEKSQHHTLRQDLKEIFCAQDKGKKNGTKKGEINNVSGTNSNQCKRRDFLSYSRKETMGSWHRLYNF
jgi:hypothetical protein